MVGAEKTIVFTVVFITLSSVAEACSASWFSREKCDERCGQCQTCAGLISCYMHCGSCGLCRYKLEDKSSRALQDCDVGPKAKTAFQRSDIYDSSQLERTSQLNKTKILVPAETRAALPDDSLPPANPQRQFYPHLPFSPINPHKHPASRFSHPPIHLPPERLQLYSPTPIMPWNPEDSIKNPIRKVFRMPQDPTVPTIVINSGRISDQTVPPPPSLRSFSDVLPELRILSLLPEKPRTELIHKIQRAIASISSEASEDP